LKKIKEENIIYRRRVINAFAYYGEIKYLYKHKNRKGAHQYFGRRTSRQLEGRSLLIQALNPSDSRIVPLSALNASEVTTAERLILGGIQYVNSLHLKYLS
jgi:hypothetical protein